MSRQNVSHDFEDQVHYAAHLHPERARDRAIALFAEWGRTRGDTKDVNECVQLVGSYAPTEARSDTSRTASVRAPEDRQGNRDRQAKTRVLRDALKPYVEHVRTQILGNSRPPVRTRAAAAKWIAERAAPTAKGRPGKAHLKRAQAALDKCNEIDKTIYCGLTIEGLALPSLGVAGSVNWVPVARETLLSRIKDAVLVMEQATQAAFPQEALLEHLLTGKRLPRADSVRIRRRLTLMGRAWPPPTSRQAATPPVPQIPRRYRFVIELDEDEVSEPRFRRIYQAIRRSVRKTGTKRITDFDWRLLWAVNELGGLPPRSQRRGFWAKVRRLLGETELTEEAIRERYRRLQRRIEA